MKIVIIGSAHPYRGGLASYNERLAKEFLVQGDDIAIETFKLQYPSFLFPGKSQYSDSPKPTDIQIFISVNSINPFNWLKIGRRIKKEAPDLVIFKYWLPFMAPCFGSIARLISSNKKTKIITIVDNIIPHESRIGDTSLSKYFTKSIHCYISLLMIR